MATTKEEEGATRVGDSQYPQPLATAVPITPAGCEWVEAFGLVPGPGFRIRAFTVYQRRQHSLFAKAAV